MKVTVLTFPMLKKRRRPRRGMPPYGGLMRSERLIVIEDNNLNDLKEVIGRVTSPPLLISPSLLSR